MSCNAGGTILVGDGNVGIGYGVDLENGYGLLAMHNLDKSYPIGTELDPLKISDCDLLLGFKNVESVNLLLEKLSWIKERMIEANERRSNV